MKLEKLVDWAKSNLKPGLIIIQANGLSIEYEFNIKVSRFVIGYAYDHEQTFLYHLGIALKDEGALLIDQLLPNILTFHTKTKTIKMHEKNRYILLSNGKEFMPIDEDKAKTYFNNSKDPIELNTGIHYCTLN